MHGEDIFTNTIINVSSQQISGASINRKHMVYFIGFSLPFMLISSTQKLDQI